MSAKRSREAEPLTPAAMLAVLRRNLPRRNGYMSPDCASLIIEAQEFGVHTRGQFQRLISRHRRQLIAYDRSALRDVSYLSHLRQEHGEDTVREALRKQRCYTWEALTRTAFEFEFGEAYEKFAIARDGL
jgi:hypothetical protein